MRTLDDALTKAQQVASRKPAIKLTLTQGANEDIYQLDRIKSINHKEEPFNITAGLVLDNSDKALTEKDYKGYKAVVSYGLITKEGAKYSDRSPMWVIPQTLNSTPGKLSCLLEMVGIPNLLAEDRASANYLPTSSDTKKVKDLIREIAGDTGVTHLACFNHTQKYDVVFDSEDTLIDVYQPKDSFTIYTNGSRLAALRRLLDYTKCVMRFGNDGKIHILQPTISEETFNYEYSLKSGHAFFAKSSRKRLVIPNYIFVSSRTGDDPQCSGFKEDTDSSDLIEVRQYFQCRLVDDAQAVLIATAILSKYQLNAEMGAAEVPINCGAELFDYVKVTDEREGNDRIGNIGSLTTTYRAKTSSKEAEYNTKFSFGGWLSVRGLMSDLEVYPSGYSEAEIAQWNAALAIAAAATAQGTADGKVTTFYADEPPTAEGVGDLWIDTNDGNKLYRWTGDAWLEIQDDAIAQAIAAAATAQSTADGKIVTFFQDAIPTATDIGDFWVDTDDKNKLYRAEIVGADEIKAGEWVLARDTDIPQAIADALAAYTYAQYILGIKASEDLRNSNDAEKMAWSLTPVKLKETKLDNHMRGVCRMKFDAWCDETQGKARIYRNGVGIGTTRTPAATYTTYSQDFDISDWAEDDLIQIYGWTDEEKDGFPVGSVYVKNFRFYYDWDYKILITTSQDP